MFLAAVERNLDHLFHCSGLCAVPWSFMHTRSLWVVSPRDDATRDVVRRAFDQWTTVSTAPGGVVPLLQQRLNEAPLYSRTSTECKFSQGATTECGDDPDADADISPDDDDDDDDDDDTCGGDCVGARFHRLHACYNLPYLYFYERMNWSLLKCGPLVQQTVPAWVVSFALAPNVLGWKFFCWYWVSMAIPVDFSFYTHRAYTPPGRARAADAQLAAVTACDRGERPDALFSGRLPGSTACDDVRSAHMVPVGAFDDSPSLAGTAAVAGVFWAAETALRRGWVPGLALLHRAAALVGDAAATGRVVRRVMYTSAAVAISASAVLWQPPLANPWQVVVPLVVTINVFVVGFVRLFAAMRRDVELPSVTSCWPVMLASVRGRLSLLLVCLRTVTPVRLCIHRWWPSQRTR